MKKSKRCIYCGGRAGHTILRQTFSKDKHAWHCKSCGRYDVELKEVE